MPYENGDNVTRAEMNGIIGPIKSDVAEIKRDVKLLLEFMNQQKGASGRVRLIADRRLAYAAITGALLAPLVWALSAHIS